MSSATPTLDPSVSHARGRTDIPLLEETISANLKRSAERWPDNEALVDRAADRRWTYEEFRRDVRILATGLLGLGVKPGDRVGIWGPNSWEWVLTQYATAEIGAILVNINPAYRQHELNYALNQSEISVVISSPAFKTSDYPAMMAAAASEVPSLRTTVIMGSPEWDALFEAGADEERLDEIAAGLDPNDAINIQYTSGTTGRPKGATLSHRNILNNGYFVGEMIDYTDEDRVVIAPPLYHCFGMVMGNLAVTSHGGTIILASQAFSASAALDAVQKEKATSLYGVPTMFVAELALDNLAEYDLSTLRTGIIAGAPCPVELMHKIINVLDIPEFSIAYGMTETAPISFQTSITDTLEQRVGTVGSVHPHVEVKIVDPGTGEAVPYGQPGELCTRGYSVMKGYWNDEAKTAEAIDEDGWMHTGDIAEMDAEGYVRITGRIKDMVIRGGENIYPREVEEFLYTHPDILDAQVIGVPDEKYGEELMAWIQMVDGAEPLTAESVAAFAEGKIARHKVPRYVRVVTSFPMTATGKIRKVAMREESIELLGLG